MAIPPDRPGEPLRPRAGRPLPADPPEPRTAVVREEYIAPAGVDPAWAARLEDRVRSLKSLLALASLLALTATGLAAWALLRDHDTDAGPSVERVSRVDAKVDRLERRLGGASQESDTRQLQEGLTGKADAADLQTLRAEVRDLRKASATAKSAGTSEDTSSAISALDGRVDDLATQIEELSAASSQTP